VLRKQGKKYEKLIKLLMDTNTTLKMEGIGLLEENTRLLMKEIGITEEQARLLADRSAQLTKLNKNFNAHRATKKMFKEIKKINETCVERNDIHDFEEKKEKLIKLIRKRKVDNPNSRNYILEGEFEDEDEGSITFDKSIE
jgi:hypothetical protein